MTTATCNEEDVSKLWIGYPLLRTSATSFVGGAMMTQALPCPYWHGTDIVRHGLSVSCYDCFATYLGANSIMYPENWTGN